MYPAIPDNGEHANRRYSQNFPSAAKGAPQIYQSVPPHGGQGAQGAQNAQQKQINYVQHPVAFGPETTKVICPSCGKKVETIIKYQAGKWTHLYAVLLSCGFICCLCCIPYCKKSCKNANHYCPNCDAYIGRY